MLKISQLFFYYQHPNFSYHKYFYYLLLQLYILLHVSFFGFKKGCNNDFASLCRITCTRFTSIRICANITIRPNSLTNSLTFVNQLLACFMYQLKDFPKISAQNELCIRCNKQWFTFCNCINLIYYTKRTFSIVLELDYFSYSFVVFSCHLMNLKLWMNDGRFLSDKNVIIRINVNRFVGSPHLIMYFEAMFCLLHKVSN